MTETTEDRAALAAVVRRWRTSYLGAPQDKAARLAGMAGRTWSSVERGLPVSSSTYYRLERVFDWAPGTVEAILNGEEAPPLPKEPKEPQIEVQTETLQIPEEAANTINQHELEIQALRAELDAYRAELRALRSAVEELEWKRRARPSNGDPLPTGV